MGFITITVSDLFFTLSSYFGKLVTNSSDMSGIIVSFSRFLVGATLMLVYILATRRSFKSPDFKPVLLRSIFNTTSIICLSASLKYTTITNANMLNMLYPVFIILLTPYYLKEKVDKSKYIYLITIMIGTYILVDPYFGSINKGDVLSFVSSIAAALSVLNLTRSLEHNEGYLVIFYVMLIGTFINIPFVWKDLANFEMASLLNVFLAGLLGFLGQILLTLGYKYVDSATGALISTSRILIAALIGVVFLNEPFNLDIVLGIVFIGGSLVGLSGYFDKDRKAAEHQE
ncbi:MAG: DMT family transporter [Tissierellaceae bacterium]